MKSGSKIIWKPPPAKKGEVNYHFVDRFTFVHFGIGMAYGGFGFGFPMTCALAFIWELIENPLKVNLTFLFPHPTADTVQNMLGDILAVCSGWVVLHFGWSVIRSVGGP